MNIAKTGYCPIILRFENSLMQTAQGTLIDLQQQVNITQNWAETSKDGQALQSQFQRLQLQISSKAQAQDPENSLPTVPIPEALARSAEKFFKLYGIHIGSANSTVVGESDPIFDANGGWQIDLKNVSYQTCTSILGAIDKFVSTTSTHVQIGEGERSNLLNSKNSLQTNASQMIMSSFRLRINLISCLNV